MAILSVRAAEMVTASFSKVLPRYVSDATGASVSVELGVPAQIVDAAIDQITVRFPRAHQWISGAGNPGLPPELPDTDLLRTGAGSRRAALLATLELYSDPTLWRPRGDVTLLIEEPEIGLHPGAQRRVAAALADLPARGLRAIVVTHSAAFVSAVPPASIRLVRALYRGEEGGGAVLAPHVVLPVGLEEISRELELSPADVLLGRRFVIVEGPSDKEVLDAWARTLGLDLAAEGCRLFVAGGESMASRIAAFMTVAYEGASFLVVLDGGPATEATGAAIRRDLGERVDVVRLKRPEIEAYYSPRAVLAWLVLNGASITPEAKTIILGLLKPAVSKSTLQRLARQYLGPSRYYSISKDGAAIARMMPERDVPGEIRSLLMRIASP